MAMNIFGLLERPAVFVVDKVTITDSVFGTMYKQVILTEQRVEPEGWYKGRGTRVGQSWTGFDTLFTSNNEVELAEEDDDCLIELVPSIREVLLVTVEDDGTAQVVISGNPIPFFPDNKIQLRIGDYTSAGDAEITDGGISWNTETSVPAFSDDDEVIIEAQPQAFIPTIAYRLDDGEEIFEAGIRFDGKLENVLGGRYLVVKHNDIRVAYDESDGSLWYADSGVQLGVTLPGQSGMTSVRLPRSDDDPPTYRARNSLLIRGREDYELLL